MQDKYDRPLNEKEHLDPDKHYIGESLPVAGTVTPVVIGGFGSTGDSVIVAREDHEHGIDLSNYYTQTQVDALIDGVIAGTIDLTGYVTYTYLGANYYDKATIDAMLAVIVASIPTALPARAVFSWPGVVSYGVGRSPYWYPGQAGEFNAAWVGLNGVDQVTFQILKNDIVVDTIVAGVTVGPFVFSTYPTTTTLTYVATDRFHVRMTNLVNYTARDLTIILEP